MSGTKQGAAKTKQTTLKRFGVDADGKSLQHKLAGSKGGSAQRSDLRGFAAMTVEELRKHSAKGGRISRKK